MYTLTCHWCSHGCLSPGEATVGVAPCSAAVSLLHLLGTCRGHRPAGPSLALKMRCGRTVLGLQYAVAVCPSLHQTASNGRTQGKGQDPPEETLRGNIWPLGLVAPAFCRMALDGCEERIHSEKPPHQLSKINCCWEKIKTLKAMQKSPIKRTWENPKPTWQRRKPRRLRRHALKRWKTRPNKENRTEWFPIKGQKTSSDIFEKRHKK